MDSQRPGVIRTSTLQFTVRVPDCRITNASCLAGLVARDIPSESSDISSLQRRRLVRPQASTPRVVHSLSMACSFTARVSRAAAPSRISSGVRFAALSCADGTGGSPTTNLLIQRCGGCTARRPSAAAEGTWFYRVPPANLLMCTANSFLIVSRNFDVQDVYVLLMRAQRVPVVGVNTCEEALKVSGLAHFGAVLFDVESRDDWESLARFRKELSRGIPIVVLSGWLAPDRTYRNFARDLGCAGFVAKPATPALVVRALQRAAEGSPWSEYMDLYA